MDVRRRMTQSILQSVEKNKLVNIPKTVAILCVESGYTKEFVQTIFLNLEVAEILFISDDKQTARFASEEIVKRGLVDDGQ